MVASKEQGKRAVSGEKKLLDTGIEMRQNGLKFSLNIIIIAWKCGIHK